MAENCEFGDSLDRVLREKFVCGIEDGKIQQRLLNETSLKTFEKTCEIALMMETTRNNLQLMQAAQINAVNTEKRGNGASVGAMRRSGNSYV